MFTVLEAYRAAMHKPVQRFRLRGQITIGARLFGFTEENVLKGSFGISNQCSGSEEVEIGTVYTAELTATFIGMDLTRYSLKDRPITADLELLTDDGWEAVPLGVYYISEANWTTWGVEVTAYDAMSKFDKTLTLSSSQGTIYDFLNLACHACGVELGVESGDVLQLPNGGESLAIYEDNDIETWRDLVAWCAQTAGAFATIDRSGRLVLRQYNQAPVDTIDDRHRLTGAKFSDFETRYTGVSMVNLATQTTSYYGLDKDDGLTYNLGSNPLVQYGLDTTLEKQRRAILGALAIIDYVPMEVSMIGSMAYDLGDVLVFSDGIADGSKLYCITKFSWTYGDTYEAIGVGKNPALANAKSKVDKNIAGLLSSSSSDVIHYYDYMNATEVHIGDGQTGRIIEFHYATTKDTHVDFHAEVVYKLGTTEEIDEDAETYVENDGVLRVSYDLNGQHVTDYAPVETRPDGTHLLHLMYTWSSTANVVGSFLVDLHLEGGEVDIGIGQARAYIAGQGLVGDDAWDGTVQIEDVVAPTSTAEILNNKFTDAVIGSTSAFISGGPRDIVPQIDVTAIITGGIIETLGGIARTHRYDPVYTDDLMTRSDVVRDSSTWKLVANKASGWIQTPVIETDSIYRVTSAHSGDDVAYIVSFDEGATWWTYADDWSTPDYSMELYGMLEGTMRSIPAAAWSRKLTGSLVVRAIMLGQATCSDICVYKEEPKT